MVTLSKSTAFNTREVMGIFWPEKLYKKIEGGKIMKKDVVWIEHGGKMLKGIVLAESVGKPIGVIELSNISQVKTELKGTVAQSDSELDDDVEELSSKPRGI